MQLNASAFSAALKKSLRKNPDQPIPINQMVASRFLRNQSKTLNLSPSLQILRIELVTDC